MNSMRLECAALVDVPTRRISNGITHIYKQWTGHGPTRVQTVIAAERVVCLLDGVMTVAERTLQANGHTALIVAQRDQLHASLKAIKIDLIQRALGRRVFSAMAAIDPEQDLCAEIFVLARHQDEGAPGRCGRPISAVGGQARPVRPA